MEDSDSEMDNLNRGGGSSRNSTGHSVRDEERLLEHLDGVLPADQSGSVKAHVAGCPECQALSEEWQRLDLELRAGLTRPSISSSFSTRVWQVIETGSDSAQARRQTNLENEWSGHCRRFFWTYFPSLLDNLGYAVSAAIAGYLLFRLSRPLLNAWTHLATNPSLQWVLPLGFGMAALSLSTAFALAAKRPIKRWLRAL